MLDQVTKEDNRGKKQYLYKPKDFCSGWNLDAENAWDRTKFYDFEVNKKCS